MCVWGGGGGGGGGGGIEVSVRHRAFIRGEHPIQPLYLKGGTNLTFVVEDC